MNGRDQNGAENKDENENNRRVIFHPSVVPSASDLHVDKVYYPEFHYDKFRGLWYINARDVGIVPNEDKIDVNSEKSVESVSDEELEWQVDENGRQYRIIDSSVPADDSDDQNSEDQPMKYPDAFRLSQSAIDRINSKKTKPVHYDEDRDLCYVICDDEDDGLVPYEEAVVGPVKDVKSDKVSVTNHGVFSHNMKSGIQDKEMQNLTPTNRVANSKP